MHWATEVLFELSEQTVKCYKLFPFARFTCAIRTGMHFNGSEEITIGGGEEVWVYVNKVLVLQAHRESQPVTKCKKISLANANGN